MSSDSAEVQITQPPSPEGLQELIDALKAASLDVATARRRVEVDCASQVEHLRAESARDVSAAHVVVEAHKRQLSDTVGAATRKLAELEERSAILAAKLSRDLTDSEAARTRLEASLEKLSSTVGQVHADRDAWEAQTRAADARHEADLQELRLALVGGRSRIAGLEAANKRLAEANEAQEERLTALETKKVFGLF